MTKYKNMLLLLLTATIWGVAFVFQSKGADVMKPFAFNFIRFLIGGVTLTVVLLIRKPFIRKSNEQKRSSKTLLIGGISCGVAMFVATNFQQFGIQYTSAGKAGFITAFYIIFVPILGLFFKKKSHILMWVAVAIAIVGLYFLCINEELTLGVGDILVFCCALTFSGHILVVDHFSPLCDGVKMSCIQFYVCGILSGISMLFFEPSTMQQSLSALASWGAWQALLYTGVCSSGIAYTLQIVGQKGLNPTIASLIMSLESVIAAIAASIIIGQLMSTREIIGAVLMFGAIVLAQLPPDLLKRRKC